MALTNLEEVYGFSEVQVKLLREVLPEIINTGLPTVKDGVTARLWGALHKNHSMSFLKQALMEFSSIRGINARKLEKYKWDKSLHNAIVNHYDGGLAAENFFLDNLMREPYSSSHFSFDHIKPRLEVDLHHKIDLLTKLNFNEGEYDESHVFGTQFHYKKMNVQYPQKTNVIHGKEKSVRDSLKEGIDETLFNEHYIPEIPCYVRVNSLYLQKNLPNEECRKIFFKAFDNWKKTGFQSVGPVGYLPERYKNTLKNMTHFYQRSCKSFIRFLYDTYSAGEELASHTGYTDLDEAKRINKFDAKQKRAQYTFYHKTGEQKALMMIAFTVTDVLEKKIKKAILRK